MYKLVGLLVLLSVVSLVSRASDRNVNPPSGFIISDTIPEVKKNTSKQEEPVKPNVIIKEVPRSRRQMKPVILPKAVPIKPIKIVKPKINTRTRLLP
jgi:hypothetical protein